MNQITNNNSTEPNKITNFDISNYTFEKEIYERNNGINNELKENPSKIVKNDNYEIIKNTFLSYIPDDTNKNNYQNSFLEIAVFSNELSSKETQLSFHLYKNVLKEIYIFKLSEENEINEFKEKHDNEEEKDEKSEDKNDENKNNNIQKIYNFVCYDPNCKGGGSLYIDLSQIYNTNYNYIFNLTKEHSLPYNEHSYLIDLKGNLQIFFNIIKKNTQIKNIQLINVPNDFNDYSCIPLGKDNRINLPLINIDTNKIYTNENDSLYLEGNSDYYQNDKYSRRSKKIFKNDNLLPLNIKRHRKPYNVIKQKEYTFVNSKINSLVYAEEKYSRGKDARLENSTSRQNWFSYIHQKFGSRTRLGPHFHRSKKDNKIYKYVIKHLLTGFEDKTLSFYCPLSSCSGKGIMNLENEIFIEVKKHDMNYENHFFRGHQIIDDYYKNHPEVTDIQVLRTQSRKDEKEKEN